MLNPADEIFQTTLLNNVNFSGVALHNGLTANLKIIPASANTGITFIRTDLDNQSNLIHANFNNPSCV